MLLQRREFFSIQPLLNPPRETENRLAAESFVPPALMYARAHWRTSVEYLIRLKADINLI